jgi:hypothetical protein
MKLDHADIVVTHKCNLSRNCCIDKFRDRIGGLDGV